MKALLVLLLLAGCSSSVDSYCDRNCAKKAVCTPGTDKNACSDACKKSEETVIPLVRSDYVKAYMDCVPPATCTDFETSCANDARKKITASAAVQNFCTQYLVVANGCMVNTFPDQATCVDRLEIYTDSTIANVRGCLTKSCSEVVFCVKSQTVPP